MNAQQLRNSILQEAIEGRLVPQDPNDEPASILLDRIRKEKERLVKVGKLKKKDLEVKPISEDEIPFEIPESWEWVRFGTITINRDSERIPLSVDERSKLKKTYDYYGASGVIDKVDRYLFDKPLLLIGEDGANLINRSTPIAFIAKGKYWVNNHAHVLDYINEVLMQYMCWYINAISLVDYVTGTAQPKMNQEKMNSIMVALPPLAEQHRIVAKIEELLPKVEEYGKAQDELNKLNEELPERLKKSILQEAIEGRLVPQDPNDEPASVLLAKIRKEKEQLVKEGKLKKKDLIETPITEEEIPFEVPESWEWVKLGTLISYQNGYAYNSLEMNRIGKGVPVIKSGNLMTLEVVLKPNNDFIEYPTEKMLVSKIVKGDMLMCLSSQSDNPEPLGKTAIYKFDTYALLNQRVLKIRPYKDELTLYLYYTINSFYFWYNVSHQGGGSAQANLKLNHVLDMQIPLPPLAEQHRIVAKIEELFAEIDKLKA